MLVRYPPTPARARCIIAMLAILGMPCGPAAVQLPVRVLTTADGLPRDQLSCVYSDDRGFVWFCTTDGLVRYDGYSAPAFGRGDGLSNPGVRTFVRDHEGRSWTGGDAGLFEFLPNARDPRQRFVEIHRADGQPTGSINAIVESSDGIWCGGGQALLYLPRGNDRLVEVDIGLPQASENDRIVRAVLEDDQGSLWVGAGSGLYRRTRDGRVRRMTVENGLPVNEVWTLAFDASQRLWAGTREGLVLIDRERVDRGDARVTRRLYTTADGIPATNVKALRVDGDTLWIGTVVGLAEAHLRPPLDLEVGRTLLGFYVWSIDIDRRGDIWAATGDGARRLARHGFTTFLKEDGLAATRVSSVFEANDGTVCATTLVLRLHLSCFRGQQWTSAPIPSAAAIADPGWGWSHLSHQDRAGRWWIPTGEGLLQFAAGPISMLASAKPVAIYSAKSGLPSGNIFRVYEDRAGGIWAATFSDEGGNGLVRIDPMSTSVRTFGSREGLPADLPITHAFAEDTDGNLWIGLEHGLLLRYRDERFEVIPLGAAPATPRLTSEHLRALLVDRRGRLWIASTVAGLGRIDRPTSAHPVVRWYGTAQGLSSDTAWVLVDSDDEDIFVGTARGVDRFDPRTERFTYFTNDEGVPRGELWGTLRDRAGRIWFATTGGLSLLMPRAPTHTQLPTTFITSVRISGTAWPISADGSTLVDGITVAPSDPRMDIAFVSPGAHAADGVRYQYHLDGVDRTWTESATRSVSLASIASGTYRFQVRATLGSGVVGQPATVAFTVLAPIWRRWWFLTLTIAGAAGIAWTLHRIRIARLLEVERVRSRIAADLHDGVGASLSRIAILSEVARSQAEAGLPAVAPALASIGQNARDLIDDMSDAVWFIDPHVDNLQEIVVRIRALASGLFDERSIAWTFDAPEDAARIRLAAEQRRHIYLFLKESLTNVARHASASRVAIHIAVRAERVHVEVDDDGIGIQPDAMHSPKGGRGLTSLRTRAAELGGAVRIDLGARGRGTRVVLDVPLEPA